MLCRCIETKNGGLSVGDSVCIFYTGMFRVQLCIHTDVQKCLPYNVHRWMLCMKMLQGRQEALAGKPGK